MKKSIVKLNAFNANFVYSIEDDKSYNFKLKVYDVIVAGKKESKRYIDLSDLSKVFYTNSIMLYDYFVTNLRNREKYNTYDHMISLDKYDSILVVDEYMTRTILTELGISDEFIESITNCFSPNLVEENKTPIIISVYPGQMLKYIKGFVEIADHSVTIHSFICNKYSAGRLYYVAIKDLHKVLKSYCSDNKVDFNSIWSNIRSNIKSIVMYDILAKRVVDNHGEELVSVDTLKVLQRNSSICRPNYSFESMMDIRMIFGKIISFCTKTSEQKVNEKKSEKDKSDKNNQTVDLSYFKATPSYTAECLTSSNSKCSCSQCACNYDCNEEFDDNNGFIELPYESDKKELTKDEIEKLSSNTVSSKDDSKSIEDNIHRYKIKGILEDGKIISIFIFDDDTKSVFFDASPLIEEYDLSVNQVMSVIENQHREDEAIVFSYKGHVILAVSEDVFNTLKASLMDIYKK